MNPILKNVLAVVAGLIVGMISNMAIGNLGLNIIPQPTGVDPKDIESIIANIDKYESKHFILPIIAHASQALFGGFIAARFAASKNLQMALIVGVLSLLGGLAMIIMVPTPTWVIIVDLALYLPAAWLGWKFAGSKK